MALFMAFFSFSSLLPCLSLDLPPFTFHEGGPRWRPLLHLQTSPDVITLHTPSVVIAARACVVFVVRITLVVADVVAFVVASVADPVVDATSAFVAVIVSAVAALDAAAAATVASAALVATAGVFFTGFLGDATITTNINLTNSEPLLRSSYT